MVVLLKSKFSHREAALTDNKARQIFYFLLGDWISPATRVNQKSRGSCEASYNLGHWENHFRTS